MFLITCSMALAIRLFTNAQFQSWCQVAVQTMPVGSLIVGVDLAPIKPIPKVITFQSDITTEKCRATIRQHFKTWKADTVLHDGAPNVGTAWVQDSFNQAELALQAMKLATEFLIEGGTFVTKVFRSKDYNSLLWVFNQLFTKVEATKPPSSRNVSAEIFVVCRGFKAPKHIDPRFLDPKSVFAELKDPTPNNEARVYKPEVKKRKRDGYEEGDYIQFKEIPASEFIQTPDPIAILGSYNKLSFDQQGNGDVALAALNKLPETTSDIREACKDLKVLGRKDFKMLLKWRLKVREIFGFPNKKTSEKKAEIEQEEVAQVEDMDEELKIQEELQALKEKDDSRRKKERRKENERKRKEIVRMQLNMTAPMDIGMEQSGPREHDSMFAIKTVDKAGIKRIVNGKMAVIEEAEAKPLVDSEDEEESDEYEDALEGELDAMYNAYRERKAEADTKYRAKKARQEFEDEDWEGFSADEQKSESSDSEELMEDEDSADEVEADGPEYLIADLDLESKPTNGLSKRAARFFSRDIFQEVEELDEIDAIEKQGLESGDMDIDSGSRELKGFGEITEGDSGSDDGIPTRQEQQTAREQQKQQRMTPIFEGSDDDSEDANIEIMEQDHHDEWEEEKRKPDGTLDIDIITAEAMTLAQELASGQKTTADVVDSGFNRYAFRDRDGLPEWFLDDEARHDKPQRPVTRAAAQAIKDKMRAMNARPIKKVREAKARKKLKAAQKLERLRKKSDALAAEDGMTEKEKAESIQKMLTKAARKKPQKETKLVVARGINRGVKGRPRGVKGRYKIVDRRMKKDMRGLKRAASKTKKR